jgi:uncharacterized protein (TIGR02117 family)
MKKLLRYSGYSLATLLTMIALYGCAALLLGVLPVNRDFQESKEGIAIYLRANEVHADIMLPTRTATRDWSKLLHVPGIARSDYVSIGWGDRAFYLETKAWADLRAGNALRALVGIDSSVMHVSAEPEPMESEQVTRIIVSPAQLTQLIAQIDASLARDAQGMPLPISHAHYANNDGFFEAQGHYSMFKTCNEWVRDLFAGAGVRTAMWSPFAEGIRYQARKIRSH